VLILVTWCGIAALVIHRRHLRAVHTLEFQAAEAGLYHVVPKIELSDVPLREAIPLIAEAGNVRIRVRWDSLGVPEDKHVSLAMEGYTVERVLDVLMPAI